MTLVNKADGSVFYYMLDVGQGEGNLIIGPNNEVILFDFGSVRDTETVNTQIVKYVHDILLEVGQKRGLEDGEAIIDYVFISHSDKDHYNQFSQLYYAFHDNGETLTVSNVFVGGSEENYTEGNIAVFFAAYPPTELTDQKYSPVGSPFRRFRYPAAGKKTAEFNLYILAANQISRAAVPKNSGADKVNRQSIVMMFEHIYDIDGKNSRKVVITADADQQVTDFIMSKYKGANRSFLQCDVMKMAHHGAIEHGCNEQKFLNALAPRIAFNSAYQSFGHPRAMALCRLKKTSRLITNLFQHTFVTYEEKKQGKLVYTTYPQVEVCDTVAIYCSYAWAYKITDFTLEDIAEDDELPSTGKRKTAPTKLKRSAKAQKVKKKSEASKILQKIESSGYGVLFTLETFDDGTLQIKHSMTTAQLTTDGHPNIRPWEETPQFDPDDPSTYGNYKQDYCFKAPMFLLNTEDTTAFKTYAKLCP